jgi:septal ring factor EnvC (AmiA/AmiB activator)
MEDPTRPIEPPRPAAPPPPPAAAPPPVAPPPPPASAAVAGVPPWELFAERLDRMRFWVYFSAAVATAAAVLGVIALIVAVNNGNNDNSANNANNSAAVSSLRSQLDSVRQDLGTLRTDVAQARRDARRAANGVDSLTTRVGKLEKSSAAQQKTNDEVTQLRTDLDDLSNRVDQVERAQENASGGGP